MTIGYEKRLLGNQSKPCELLALSKATVEMRLISRIVSEMRRANAYSHSFERLNSSPFPPPPTGSFVLLLLAGGHPAFVSLKGEELAKQCGG